MSTKCDRQIMKQSKAYKCAEFTFLPKLVHSYTRECYITVTIPGKKYIKAVTNPTTQNVGSLS